MTVVDLLLLGMVLLATVPCTTLLIETLAALLHRLVASVRSPATTRPGGVILIPAHDEAAGIAPTVTALLPHLQSADRVLVIADNCTDATAQKVRELGLPQVRVHERSDSTRRGKGYALDAGIALLATQPPAWLVILDADCTCEPGTLESLWGTLQATGLPAQAAYLPGVRDDGSVRSQVARFALRFKNEVRPTGLGMLGGPCLLTGSGMAFSWDHVRSVSWASGNIVEDMQLGLDLAIAGAPPQFCPAARVGSVAPPSESATLTQRTRWEHGHVSTLLRQTPRLLWNGLRQFRPGLILLALELSVPPLALLVLGLIALTAISGLSWGLGGDGTPLLLCGLNGVALSLTIFLAWCKYGRGIVPFRSLVRLPGYLLWKLPIYLRLVGRRERAWVRTDRAQS